MRRRWRRAFAGLPPSSATGAASGSRSGTTGWARASACWRGASMATRVLLTVDTELRWDGYVRGASWRENLALSYDPAGVGAGHQLARLAAHGLKACFFVDPM